MRWLVVVALVGCGRISFDPFTGGGGIDDAQIGDGIGGDTLTSSPGGESCATPRTTTVGRTLMGESIAGATDDVAAGPCSAIGVDVVYAFTSTNGTQMVTIDADFDGTITITPMCPVGTSFVTCASFQAGVPETTPATVIAGTTYVIVDKTGGTGTTLSLSVQ